eukprot:Filipodium_phascolosomae@DN7954_c0_g1_i1.p1
MSAAERAKQQPRAVLLGGKAAPGYAVAKLIITLANYMGNVINKDEDIKDLLKLVFLPNYNVSSAQVIIPAADVSQHISTAGTEASGTSNMKFVMNGGLILGTMDGANIEIREEGGAETMFIFGASEPDVTKLRANARAGIYPIDPRLREVFDALRSGVFSCHDSSFQNELNGLIERLLNNGAGHNGDYYLICHDFPSYCDAQQRVDSVYSTDKSKWWRLSIQAAGTMGKFSTDRSMKEYAEKIWNLEPAERPDPRDMDLATGSFPSTG